MSEQNRRLILQFFSHLSDNDLSAALDMLADDAHWWIAGKAGTIPSAGTYTKEKIGRLLGRMAAQMPGGLRMTVKSTIAEDDRVAAEVESQGALANGRQYDNEYHFALRIRDGKISEVREYLDTQHVFDTWFRE